MCDNAQNLLPCFHLTNLHPDAACRPFPHDIDGFAATIQILLKLSRLWELLRSKLTSFPKGDIDLVQLSGINGLQEPWQTWQNFLSEILRRPVSM